MISSKINLNNPELLEIKNSLVISHQMFLSSLRKYYINKISAWLYTQEQKQWLKNTIKEQNSKQWDILTTDCERIMSSDLKNPLVVSILPFSRVYYLESDIRYLKFIKKYLQAFINIEQDKNVLLFTARLCEAVDLFYLLLEDKQWTDDEFEHLIEFIYTSFQSLFNHLSCDGSFNNFKIASTLLYISSYFSEFQGSHKKIRSTLPVVEGFVLDNILTDGFSKDTDTSSIVDILNEIIKIRSLFFLRTKFSPQFINRLEKASSALANVIMPDKTILYNSKGLNNEQIYSVVQKVRLIIGKKPIFDYKKLDIDCAFSFGKKYINQTDTDKISSQKSAVSFPYTGLYIQRAVHHKNINTLCVRTKKQPGFDMFLSEKPVIQNQELFEKNSMCSVDLWAVGKKRRMLRITGENSRSKTFLLEQDRYWIVADSLMGIKDKELIVKYKIKIAKIVWNKERGLASVRLENGTGLIICPVSNVCLDISIFNSGDSSEMVLRAPSEEKNQGGCHLVCVFYPSETERDINLKVRSTWTEYGPSAITVFREKITDSIPFRMFVQGEEGKKR